MILSRFFYAFADFEPLLNFGSVCHRNSSCRSKHCIPSCDSSERYCIEPRWFYRRYGASYPNCASNHHIESYKEYYNPDVRQIGESCAVSSNCITGNCIKKCDSTEFICAELESFFKFHDIDVPVCVNPYVDMPENPGPWNIGQPCGTNIHCSSDNCVPLCEKPSESRCIEPIQSFQKYNIPAPVCVKEEVAKMNVKFLLADKRVKVNAKSLFFNEFVLKDKLIDAAETMEKKEFNKKTSSDDANVRSRNEDSHNKIGSNQKPDSIVTPFNDHANAHSKYEVSPNTIGSNQKPDSIDGEEDLGYVQRYFSDLDLTN